MRDPRVTGVKYSAGMADRLLGKHYLRQWREYRGYSLRTLAERMESEPGIPMTSHAKLGRVETFKQPYSQEIMEAAAVALNCTVRDLLEVDPTKEGEVVDLMRLLKRKDLATVRAIIEGLPDKTGT